MRYVYDVTAINGFHRPVSNKFHSRDMAETYAKIMRDDLYNDVQVDEGIEFSSKEEELMLSKIMHDCYLRGFEAGFNLREVKGNEQK